MKRFRGRLVFKAHRLVYHSNLGWRVIKKRGGIDLIKFWHHAEINNNTERSSHRKVIYRGTSPIGNIAPLGPYSRPMPRVIWRSWGGLPFLMSEVPL